MPGQEPDYRLDINRASADELAQLEELDAEAAAAIVRFRERNGRIGGPGDLQAIPEISAQTARQLRDRVRFL